MGASMQSAKSEPAGPKNSKNLTSSLEMCTALVRVTKALWETGLEASPRRCQPQ